MMNTVYLLVSFAFQLLVPLVAEGAEKFELGQPVKIQSGLLQGIVEEAKDVVAFKGIPYAAPPIGDLRWREPQPPVKWDGLRRADQFGPACFQPPSPSGKRPAQMSEDCLFLNVWAPLQSAGDSRAVLFFIHGGAGLFGSGNLNGAELARKGIIVVTVNYRLGIFAGMGHPELTAQSPHRTCGTYGMLDLIAALQWVQRNIGAFGGDPARVTIAGHSSGANAVHYLTTSPVAKGLFRAAIAISFPCDYLTKPHTIPFIRQKEENGVAFARIKNCKSLADLRRLAAEDLIAPDPALAEAKLIHLAGGIARDGWAFPLTYPDALDKGLPSDVPTLIGMTADDFGPPAKVMTTTAASFAQSLPALFGENQTAFIERRDDFLRLCPVTSDPEARQTAKLVQIEYRLSTIFYWAQRRARTARSPVYTYVFEQTTPSPRGAYHGSDLAYWFNDVKNQDRPWTDVDRRVADEVSSYWVHFVNSGNPNGGSLPRWQAFDPGHPSTMSLGHNSAPRSIADKDRLSFYRDLLGRR